jgi:hypothetical protein
MDGEQRQANDSQRPEQAGQAPDRIRLMQKARGGVEEAEEEKWACLEKTDTRIVWFTS